MSFYGRLEQTSIRLIETYGKTVNLIRVESSGPAHAPVLTEASHAGKAVDIGYTLTRVAQSQVQVGDKLGLLSVELDVTPRLQDLIEIDGDRYRFVDLQPLNPGGTVLLYEFLARV